MILIGEKINATRKSIAEAITARDAEHIARTARDQAEAGADYLDLNGGDPDEKKETENLLWLVETARSATDLPLCIDTASAAAADEALSAAGDGSILNSVSMESDRLEAGLEVAGKHECSVVALLMTDDGPPGGIADRVERAAELITRLRDAGKSDEKIIVDPCFLPLASDPAGAQNMLASVRAIRERFGEVHVGGGLSNLSHGLPARRWVNLAALCMAVAEGLDAIIADPCTEGVVPLILAAEALAGRDEFCMNYVNAQREGKL